MTVGKSVSRWLGLTLLVTALVLGCEGDEGPMGPRGFDGTQGDPGQNRTADPIADQVFGILINNSTAVDFNGAMMVQLTSDASATPSASRVVARDLEKAPVIDGIDGGTAEWGDAVASNITLSTIAGADNGVSSVSMRVGYNFENVYVQLKWTETATAPFVIKADTTKNQWRASSATSWSQSGGEDRVILAFEINDITGWNSEGLGAIFDGATFATPAEGEIADLWEWGSTVNYYFELAQDRVVRDAGNGGLADDVGGPYVWLNDRFNSRPRYMRANSPITGSDYPLYDFEYTSFVRTLAWRAGATIPGYVYLEPSRSAANVLAVGKFSNGTWTVELQRKRRTGQADDAIL